VAAGASWVAGRGLGSTERGRHTAPGRRVDADADDAEADPIRRPV